MDETRKFKVGDVVEAFGLQGKIEHIENTSGAPVQVFFEIPGRYNYFTLDGKYHSWHKEPSLKLISRPKRKVTKTVEAYAIITAGFNHAYVYKTYTDAIDAADIGDLGPIKLTGTYEIEVED